MPLAPTSSSLSFGTLSQCKPRRVWEREMTSDIGRELEFPKTCVSLSLIYRQEEGEAYPHRDDKVLLTLLEAEAC
jgi:hypothetical protein